MSKSSKVKREIDRRRLLQGLSAFWATGMLPGIGKQPTAFAQSGVKDVTVFYYTNGGHSPIFTSADSLLNAPGENSRFQDNLRASYGATNGNIRRLGNSNLYIDRDWLDKLTRGPNQNLVQSCMATVGAVHGQSAHTAAVARVLSTNGRNSIQQVANAMRGESAIRYASVGSDEVRGRSMTRNSNAQRVNDVGALEDALGGGSQGGNNNNAPRYARKDMASGVEAAKKMSAKQLLRSPQSLRSLDVAYDKAVESYSKQIISNVTPAQIRNAYNINSSAVRDNSMATKMAAAELLARTGTSVIAVSDGGYDNHNDRGQRQVRRLWEPNLNAISIFLNRMIADPSINLTFVIMGDFSRNERSGHGGGCSYNVISRKLQNGSTGRVDARGNLRNGPSMAQFYEFITHLGGGGNGNYNGPHRNLLKRT